MTTKESHIALILSEMIKRLSSEEKIELMRHITWEELEEWKATQETLADRRLMANLHKGLVDEEKGNVSEVGL